MEALLGGRGWQDRMREEGMGGAGSWVPQLVSVIDPQALQGPDWEGECRGETCEVQGDGPGAVSAERGQVPPRPPSQNPEGLPRSRWVRTCLLLMACSPG